MANRLSKWMSQQQWGPFSMQFSAPGTGGGASLSQCLVGLRSSITGSPEIIEFASRN